MSAQALAGVILQRQSTPEVRAVLTACMLARDAPAVLRAQAEDLQHHAPRLRSGGFMPVGSVEYVRAAMAIAGIEEPQCDPYPPALQPWMGRTLALATAAEVLATATPLFVKPARQLKAFDGFVLRRDEPPQEHAQEQLQALCALPPDTPVWTSDAVTFLSEWRFYVQDQQILGSGRYDPDGEEDAPAPDRAAVLQAIAAYGRTGCYALDMGVLADGKTALVEVNDAWATGLYQGALTPADYFAWLTGRWLELASDNSRKKAP